MRRRRHRPAAPRRHRTSDDTTTDPAVDPRGLTFVVDAEVFYVGGDAYCSGRCTFLEEDSGNCGSCGNVCNDCSTGVCWDREYVCASLGDLTQRTCDEVCGLEGVECRNTGGYYSDPGEYYERAACAGTEEDYLTDCDDQAPSGHPDWSMECQCWTSR